MYGRGRAVGNVTEFGSGGGGGARGEGAKARCGIGRWGRELGGGRKTRRRPASSPPPCPAGDARAPSLLYPTFRDRRTLHPPQPASPPHPPQPSRESFSVQHTMLPFSAWGTQSRAFWKRSVTQRGSAAVSRSRKHTVSRSSPARADDSCKVLTARRRACSGFCCAAPQPPAPAHGLRAHGAS